jgi:flagellar motor switch protein FliN/FliY
LPEVPDTSSAAGWLTQEWMARLASSVEMMTEVSPGLTLGSHAPASATEVPEALWYSIPLNVAADAAVFAGAVEDTWFHIGKSALLAAGVAEVGPADARSTYLEIITQATSGLANAIAARLETPVSSLPAVELQPGDHRLADAAGLSLIEISLGGPPPRKLYMAWSRALESALTSAKPKSRELAEGGHSDSKRVAAPEKSRTLDLLMEVDLPISVSFGRAQLALRDVLKLNSGSIVELNRTISDPVEIIVNNCVIARGEVVVVEGNYGVRIQQVISREERLRTLK